MKENQLKKLLDKLQLHYEPFEIKKLNDDFKLLQICGLSRMVDRLLCSNKPTKFLETLTEVNFTAQLIKSFPYGNRLTLEYEPPALRRPIDLLITLNGVNYFLQIKSLARSIRENHQSKIVREIRRGFVHIQSNRIVSIRVSKHFSEAHVASLLSFIKESQYEDDGTILIFEIDNFVLAEVEFNTPAKSFRDHLGLFMFSDLKAVDITGMTKDQIRKSLENGVGAFENDNSKETINLIVSEIKNDTVGVADFAEAIYGTELHTFRAGDLPCRGVDGVFLQESFAKRVAAIIILHKREPLMSSYYDRAICCNPLYDFLKPVTDLIHEKIIERFTWIETNYFSY